MLEMLSRLSPKLRRVSSFLRHTAPPPSDSCSVDKLFDEVFLEDVDKLRRFAADGLAVYLVCDKAERTGRRDDDFIGIHKLGDSKRSLVNRDIVRLACSDKMRAGDAGQDIMIGRMGLEYTVLYNMYVAVSALGDSVAAMENALVAACLGGLLSRHNARDEVEGLNIAMKESCVLKGYELNALRKILDLCGLVVTQMLALPSLGNAWLRFRFRGSPANRQSYCRCQPC